MMFAFQVRPVADATSVYAYAWRYWVSSEEASAVA